MPYRNIVFVKLEKRLLNDPRWWTMSDYSQLIYIKLMLLAAETYNKIPLNDDVVMRAVRCSLGLKEFKRCMGEIARNFPKLKKNKHFRYFEEFEHKTNWVNPKETPGNSQGVQKAVSDQDQEKDQEKEKDKRKKKPQGGLFSESQERQIKTKIAQTHDYNPESEATKIAFDHLVKEILKDKDIKNPMAVALHRAALKV